MVMVVVRSFMVQIYTTMMIMTMSNQCWAAQDMKWKANPKQKQLQRKSKLATFDFKSIGVGFTEGYCSLLSISPLFTKGNQRPSSIFNALKRNCLSDLLFPSLLFLGSFGSKLVMSEFWRYVIFGNLNLAGQISHGKTHCALLESAFPSLNAILMLKRTAMNFRLLFATGWCCQPSWLRAPPRLN